MTSQLLAVMRHGLDMIHFFDRSLFLDYDVLRPLSHIRANWELSAGDGAFDFLDEEDSFAKDLSLLIDELEITPTPKRYHDNEDHLAELVKRKTGSDIYKLKSRWVGQDYRIILQDGGLYDDEEKNLVQAAKGRISAAIAYGQAHYDEMEDGHRIMLAVILTLILYCRADNA